MNYKTILLFFNHPYTYDLLIYINSHTWKSFFLRFLHSFITDLLWCSGLLPIFIFNHFWSSSLLFIFKIKITTFKLFKQILIYQWNEIWDSIWGSIWEKRFDFKKIISISCENKFEANFLKRVQRRRKKKHCVTANQNSHPFHYGVDTLTPMPNSNSVTRALTPLLKLSGVANPHIWTKYTNILSLILNNKKGECTENIEEKIRMRAYARIIKQATHSKRCEKNQSINEKHQWKTNNAIVDFFWFFTQKQDWWTMKLFEIFSTFNCMINSRKIVYFNFLKFFFLFFYI